MDGSKSWVFLLLVLAPVLSGAWREERREPREPREMRRPGVHYHSKRHMLPQEPEKKKRGERTTVKPLRELRKKPSGHLTPLEEDDMENEEVVSVAIGPPPMRPKFDKHKKQTVKQSTHIPQPPNATAVNLVREVLTELGKEFLTKDLNENFVFGQYIGNAMKNLTSELRLKMQHDILDLIVKYQNLNSGDMIKEHPLEIIDTKKEKQEKIERKFTSLNETDESWPDFSNLAKIVG